MKELIDKITSYNLFNYLFPGIIFTIILDQVTSYSFIQNNILIGVFVYYFIGLVISRFGSLVIEPFLKQISFLKFSDYSDFIIASKKDPKIELFSEINNMFRTIVSMFLLIILLKVYNYFSLRITILIHLGPYILIGLLLVMFLFSYKKQTGYITKRIKAVIKGND